MLNYVEKSLSAFPKAMRQEFVGEVGKFVTFWCQVSSDVVYQKIESVG